MPERASRPQVGVCLWPHTGTPLVYVRSWSTGHRCSPDARFPALVAANHRDRGNLATVVTGLPCYRDGPVGFGGYPVG